MWYTVCLPQFTPTPLKKHVIDNTQLTTYNYPITILCKTPCPNPGHHKSCEPAGYPLAEGWYILHGLQGGLPPPAGWSGSPPMPHVMHQWLPWSTEEHNTSPFLCHSIIQGWWWSFPCNASTAGCWCAWPSWNKYMYFKYLWHLWHCTTTYSTCILNNLRHLRRVYN